uniref:Gustatory receptor n=1 Tax=Strigamia maritima TaxID=126957 RepID=T1JP82_STRMM
MKMAGKAGINVHVENLRLRFINRVWRVVLGVFGLQLDIFDVKHSSNCWKKIIYAGSMRLLHAITNLHIFVVFTYDFIRNVKPAFPLISLLTSQLISFYTAIICLKRGKKIRVVYRKIIINLSTAEDLLTKFDRNTKFYFLLLMVTTTTLTINHILKFIRAENYQLKYREFHAQMGIHNDYFSNITAVIDYFGAFMFTYLFMDVMFVYFAHLCNGLALNFLLFNRCLETELRSISLTPSKLNVLRHQYGCISELVDEVSRLFSPLILLWISSLVSNLCLDIRAIKSASSTGVVLFYSRFILNSFRGTIFLLLILKMASQINTQAHLMKQKLLLRAMDERADKIMSKANYQLFCDAIGSSNIGISVSGLFTLNITSLLNIVGTVLTYTIILYQTA